MPQRVFLELIQSREACSIEHDEDQDLFRQTYRANINATQNSTSIDLLVNNENCTY